MEMIDRKRRVLVVEDEPLVRDVIAAALRSAGYDVLAVKDATEAAAILRRGPVDVLFSGLPLLGGDSGWAIAQRLRMIQPSLPVVYATAAEARRSADDPESLRLPKPFSVAHVVRAVAALAPAPADRHIPQPVASGDGASGAWPAIAAGQEVAPTASAPVPSKPANDAFLTDADRPPPGRRTGAATRKGCMP